MEGGGGKENWETLIRKVVCDAIRRRERERERGEVKFWTAES